MYRLPLLVATEMGLPKIHIQVLAGRRALGTAEPYEKTTSFYQKRVLKRSGKNKNLTVCAGKGGCGVGFKGPG